MRTMSIAGLLMTSFWVMLTSCASTAHTWEKPPKLDDSACARVESTISPSPLIKEFDGFILVISYEPIPKMPRDSISLYLVHVFHLTDNNHAIIDAQSLLVTMKSIEPIKNLHWIISDSDGDGSIDKAHLIETVKDSHSNRMVTTESDASAKKMHDLQIYFDEVRRKIYSHSEDACMEERVFT